MRICVLEDGDDDSDAPFHEYDPPADLDAYFQGYEVERHLIQKKTAVRQVHQLARQGFDVYLNLCDGAWDEDRPGIEVVLALERAGVAFTGAASAFYEPTRQMTKAICYYQGIGTPPYVFVEDLSDVDAAATLQFPLIVKHPNSYSSVGLTRESCVWTTEQLHCQARQMVAAYGGALIEEYIEGREFTVLVAENAAEEGNPIVYQPIEFLFPPGESFKHFELKWVGFKGLRVVPCADPALIEQLQDMSRRLFVGLRGTGYGRCDIRMNAAGELFMLEINPNCGVFYSPNEEGSADFILRHDPRGHRHFIEQILYAALKRCKERQKRWEVRFAGSGYGLYAVQPIRASEIIDPLEERPHALVSKAHVERCWTPQQKVDFSRYAYPLTDEMWVMWSSDPAEWKPINHSCDPNAWLEGLDMVARRDIAAGEQITIDYATFCNEEMEDFDCACGSPDCRGVVRGTDYLQPFIQRYGRHVSDYVRRKRLERGLR